MHEEGTRFSIRALGNGLDGGRIDFTGKLSASGPQGGARFSAPRPARSFATDMARAKYGVVYTVRAARHEGQRRGSHSIRHACAQLRCGARAGARGRMEAEQVQKQRNAQAARRTRMRRKERISALKSSLHTTQVRIECLRWYEAVLLSTMREHRVALPPACQESLDEIDACLHLAVAAPAPAHERVGEDRQCAASASSHDAAMAMGECVPSARTHDKHKHKHKWEGGDTTLALPLLEMTSPLTQ